MAKLKQLASRVQTLSLTRTARPIQVERMRGRALQESNARIRAHHPLCVGCEAQGRVTVGTEVDHIIPLHLGGQDIDANRQLLCHDCHAAKSTREAQDRLNGIGPYTQGSASSPYLSHPRSLGVARDGGRDKA